MALPDVFSLAEAMKGSWASIAALCVLFEEREWSNFLHYSTLSVLLCKYKLQFIRLIFLHRLQLIWVSTTVIFITFFLSIVYRNLVTVLVFLLLLDFIPDVYCEKCYFEILIRKPRLVIEE